MTAEDSRYTRVRYTQWNIIIELVMQQANNQNQFVLCINNKEYQADLQIQKIYQVIFEFKASQHRMIRVVDESDEDYLYPSNYFILI